MGNNISDEAVKLAIEGRWEEAVAINQSIIEVSPSDIEAHNRLGKALAELGRNSEAREAYKRVMELDPRNTIAQRNLKRLVHLKDEKRSAKESRGIDGRFFIQDTSKARMVSLNNTGDTEILAKLSAGEEVQLQVDGKKLIVTNDSGEYLGRVESRIESRLSELMEGGNEYKAAVSSSRDDNVTIIIRETFQHSSQLGYPSFPPGSVKEINPYVKGSLVMHDIEDELAEEMGEMGDWGGEEEVFGQDDILAENEAPPLQKENATRTA
ncbi:MAG: tetratricopeptide repeat protein [Chloroflexi bacterium]|nr:tetratricopeptide repeat protein [Chloroflexota bacterium]